MRRVLAILVGISLISLVPVFARAAGTPALDFRVVCADGALPTDLRYLPYPTGASAPVEFVADRRSATFSYRGPSPIVFFREQRGNGGPPARFAVARADFAAGARALLLVFVPGGDPGRLEEFSVIAVEETPDTFFRGMLRVLNLTGTKSLARVGAENREIAGLDHADFHFHSPRASRIDFGLAIWAGSDWRVTVDTDLVLADDRRYLMLIVPAGTPDAPTLHYKLLED